MASSLMVRGGTVNSNKDSEAKRQFWLGDNTAEGQKKKSEEEKEQEYQEYLVALALNLNVLGDGHVAKRLAEKRDLFSTSYSWSNNGFVPGTGQMHEKLSGSMDQLRNDVTEIKRDLEAKLVHEES